MCAKQHIAGFSLLEIVVSLLLLSFMLLSFEATELYSLRAIRAAYYFDTASQQLHNMVEQLRVFAPHDTTGVVALWNAQNHVLLPAGYGTVQGHFPDYQVTLYWGHHPASCSQNQLGINGCLSLDVTL